ncbi:MAG TPA: DNA/RNA non-specific endonuclease, partial [Gemmataceae bacterium]|nr:DNA/RNA non-specific endonuclease [Gemmataceae bacterium]
QNPAGLYILQGYTLYERGHLLGNSLGGEDRVDNLAPMPNLTNRGGAGMYRPEQAARDAIGGDSVITYRVQCDYDPAGVANLAAWLAGEFASVGGVRQILPNAAGELFEMAAVNAPLTNQAMAERLFGPNPTSAEVAAVAARHWPIRGRLARYFLARRFTVTMAVVSGQATVPSGAIVAINHQGVTLP